MADLPVSSHLRAAAVAVGEAGAPRARRRRTCTNNGVHLGSKTAQH